MPFAASQDGWIRSMHGIGTMSRVASPEYTACSAMSTVTNAVEPVGDIDVLVLWWFVGICLSTSWCAATAAVEHKALPPLPYCLPAMSFMFTFHAQCLKETASLKCQIQVILYAPNASLPYRISCEKTPQPMYILSNFVTPL